ncbi:MAG: NAD(P)-dependent dehydrogenase (short-subunit alcohol dehydrogenase family) [Pirellulaceae bacterium]|jgi:NAD(P)-dependent dehydrogenase (short-subunit alcohol dehydrogenase family)
MESTSKIALVTGAGSGIGRSVSTALLKNGFRVVLTGRRESTLQETIELAGGDASNTLAVVADVTQPDSVRQLFAKTAEAFGRLDVLFNNAGINVPAVPLEDLPFEHWQSVVDTNLTGSFLCTQEAIKLMRDQSPQGGRIINNGSISASAPRPMSVAYTATKHAITGLTKSTSLDVRKYNIACGQIDIGNASTDMTGAMQQGVPQADGSIATEPTMSVENVANAILYMVSLPLDANVQFLTVMATQMPLIGRG